MMCVCFFCVLRHFFKENNDLIFKFVKTFLVANRYNKYYCLETMVTFKKKKKYYY